MTTLQPGVNMKKPLLEKVLRQITNEQDYTLEERIAEKLLRQFPELTKAEWHAAMRDEMLRKHMSEPHAVAILNAMQDRRTGFKAAMAPPRTYLTEES